MRSIQRAAASVDPDVMRVGGRTLVSVESAARWRAQVEATTREAAKAEQEAGKEERRKAPKAQAQS